QDARAEVGDGDADAHRSLAGNARDAHQPAHALRDLVHSGPIPVRAALPEARDAPVDQARVDLAQALVVDAQALLHAGAVILDDDVRLPRELLEDLDTLGILEVERHAPLVAVQVLEVEAVARAAHAVARATARHLDLDGVRPPVHELAHAGRAGAGARQVEDIEAGQGQRGVLRHGVRSSRLLDRFARHSMPFGATRILPLRSPRCACVKAVLISSIGYTFSTGAYRVPSMICRPRSAYIARTCSRERVASPRPRMKPTRLWPPAINVLRDITGSSPLIEP